jgi:hypothetical protein
MSSGISAHSFSPKYVHGHHDLKKGNGHLSRPKRPDQPLCGTHAGARAPERETEGEYRRAECSSEGVGLRKQDSSQPELVTGVMSRLQLET